VIILNAALEAESTLTDRDQTTVPETVRRALKLGKPDKLQYTIRPCLPVSMRWSARWTSTLTLPWPGMTSNAAEDQADGRQWIDDLCPSAVS